MSSNPHDLQTENFALDSILKRIEELPLCFTRNDDTILDPRLFAHIHNDIRIRGTTLEGNSFTNVILHFYRFLEFIQNPDNLTQLDQEDRQTLQLHTKRLKEKFTFLLKIEARCNEIREAGVKDSASIPKLKIDIETCSTQIIEQLNQQGTVIIAGGWNGIYEAGHALSYKFSKQKEGENESILFTVYNTGAGLEYHLKIADTVDKYWPLLTYRIPLQKDKQAYEIQQKELALFITRLLKARIEPAWVRRHGDTLYYSKDKYSYEEYREISTPLNAKKMYKQVFDKLIELGGDIIDPDYNQNSFPYLFTHGQWSGTCSLRNILSLVREEFPTLASFELMLFQYRFQTIIDFYRNSERNDPLNKAVFEQLYPAIKNFAGFCKKLIHQQKPPFQRSENNAKQVFTFLNAIKSVLDKIYNTKTNQLGSKTQQEAYHSLSMENLPTHFRMYQSFGGIADPKPCQPIKFNATVTDSLPKFDNIESYHHYLIKCIKQLIEYKNKDISLHVIIEVEKLVFQFPLKNSIDCTFKLKPKNNKETEEILLNCLDSLQLLRRLYAEECAKIKNILFVERALANYCILAFEKRIIETIFKNRERNPIDINNFLTCMLNFEYNLTRRIKKDLESPFCSHYTPELDDIIDTISEIFTPDKSKSEQYSINERYELQLINMHSLKESFQKIAPTHYRFENINLICVLYDFANGNFKYYYKDYFEDPKLQEKINTILSDFALCLRFRESIRDTHSFQTAAFTSLTNHVLTDENRLKKVKHEVVYQGNYGRYSCGDGVLFLNDSFSPNYLADLNDSIKYFSSAYPPIKNSNIEYTLISEANSLKSNDIITRMGSYKDFLHSVVFTRVTSQTQLIATLDLISKNIEALQDQDIQTLLQLNIFTPRLLKQQLTRTPEFSLAVISFIEQGIEYYSKNIGKNKKFDSTGLFLFKLAIPFKQAIIKLLPNEITTKIAISRLQELEKTLDDTINFNEAQTRSTLTPQIRSEIESTLKDLYAIKLLQLGNTLPFPAKVTHKLAVQVINQNLYQHIVHNSEGQFLSHHLEQYQIAKTMEKLRKPLQLLFENLTLDGKCNLLNSILVKASLGELLPLNKIKWDKFNFPVISGTFEQEHYQINLFTGNIQTTNCIVAPLPRYFYTNEFLELFGKMPRKVKLWTYPSRRNEMATTAEFIEDGQRYRVRFWERNTIHELTVEKFVEKSQTWFSLLKGSDYTGYRSFLPQSLFCNGEKVWRVNHSSNEQQQIIKLIITDKNNKTKYEGRGSFEQLSLWSMTPKEELENRLVNVSHAIEKNDDLFILLAKFEDTHYIEAWLEPKEKVLNIKLPRFGLEFRSETIGNGNIDFVWLKDPRYKIKMSKTSLPVNDFDLFLTLETRCTKTLKDIIILIPALQFNVGEEICTDGFHYKPSFNFKNQSILNSKNRYYHLYSLEERSLKAKHATGNLYLAYIYLVYHQFHESYHALALFCNAVGTLSKHELELLHRILSRPQMVLASGTETLTPEKIAVQILAASILNNFISTQTTTLDFNEHENSVVNAYAAINPMGASVEKTLKEFYEVTFTQELVKLLTIHNNMRGKIPTYMRLNPSEELSLFKSILSKIQHFPYTALYHRFQSLNIRFLLKEKHQLQATSTDPKGLSFTSKARIQELDSSLRKNAYLLARNTQFKTITIKIIPNGKEMISSNIHESIGQHYSGYRPAKDPLPPLSMSISEATFYHKFPALYKLAHTPTNETNAEEKGYLKFFIQGKLRHYLNPDYNVLEDSDPHKKNLSLCCQQLIEILYYVVENPEHQWPEYQDYSNNRLDYSSLLKIQNEAIKLFQQKPLELTISVTQHHDCSLFRSINKSLSSSKNIPINNSKDNHVDCLITELQLSEFYQAYTKCSEALYKKDTKSEEEQMTLMNKTALDSEPYLLSQTQHFRDELNRGKLINQRTVAENELFVKYLFDKKSQAKILECLNHKDNGIMAVDTQLKELENALLNFANSKLNTALASIHTRFSVLSDKRTTISLRDLFTLYLQGDIQQYTKTTFLDNETARKLHQEMHHYLCKLSHQKHRKRVYQLLKIINKLDEQHSDYINLLHRLGRELVAKRSYNEQQHPELLVFEIIEDLLIRPEQAAILNRMLSKSDNYYNNVFIQLIMGGGKSKILEPLLAIKKANGTNLVILEVPQSLFETNFSDIYEVITRISNIKPIPFLFERRSFSDPEYLDKLYEKLNQCIIDRGFLVTTSESIKSMQLKYQELLYSHEVNYLTADNKTKQIYSDSLFMFEKILKLFKTRGDAILSEPDVALDPKRELIYNIAGEESINLADRSTLVKIHACLDKIEVPSIDRKCTLDQISNESYLISSETEWKGAFFNFAVFLVYNSGSPLKYLTKLTDYEKDVICHYLLNQKIIAPRGVSLQYQTILNKLTLSQRNELALIKGELSDILPLTLKRKKNVHFGLSHDPKNKNQGIAIPYKGNNTPNENSEFGSPFESACYTLRLMDKTPLTPEILTTMITDFKLRANQQISESRLVHNRGLTCRETDTAKEFLELVGVALDDIDETNSRNISELLNMLLKQKRRKVFEYCWMHYVLNKVQRHNLTLRSDGQNHVSQFRTVQGMSGTLDDYRAFHQNILFDPSFSHGTDGVTLDHLERHVSMITQTHHTSAAKFLAENFNAAKLDSAPIHSIIDVGAMFSGQENIDVAHSIKQFLNSINSTIQFILYFNKNHTICALSLDNRGIIAIGNSKPKLIAEKLGLDLDNWSKFCFTYYDQVHTRGIDILQPMPSTGILTIGLITGKDDLLQGAMRLRDLANSQCIQIAIPKEVAESMPAVSSFTWKIVRDMTLDVHKLRVAENNLRSIPQKLHNVIHEHLFYGILLKEKDLPKKLALAQIFKPVFVTQQSSDAMTLFGEIDEFVTTQSLIAVLKKEKLELWESMLRQANIKVSMETRAKIEQTMEKICSQAHLYCLSKTKSTNIHNKDSRIELQTQTSKQKEKEKDLEAQREYQSNSLLPKEMVPWNISLVNLKMVPESYSKYNHEGCQIFYLNTMLGYSQPSFFSKNLLVSENFAYTCRDQMVFMGKHTKPVFFTLFIEEQNSTLNALIITSEEADIFLEKYNKEKDEFEKSGRKLWIVSPYDHYLVGSTSKIMHPEYVKLKEQICYFNGDPDELTRLYKKTAWIKEDRPIKLNYLEKVILNVHQGKQRFMPQFMQHMQKKDDEHQVLQDKLAKLKQLATTV